MTQEELNEVLKLHKLWLDGNGEEGKKADLRNNDLRCANLRGANLAGANLTGADLSGAYLSGANLEGTGIYFFDGPIHQAIYNQKDDKLCIGCQVHNLEYWLNNYVDIGRKYDYSDEEIEIYGNWIKSLKELT